MPRYVLDADSIMAFLEDRPGAAIIADLLWKSVEAHKPLLMSVVSWGCAFQEISKSYGEAMAESKMQELRKLSIELVVADAPIAIVAASMATKFNVPYINSFAVALAWQRKATLVTTRAESKFSRELKVLVAG